jgi:hypothetical protein
MPQDKVLAASVGSTRFHHSFACTYWAANFASTRMQSSQPLESSTIGLSLEQQDLRLKIARVD